ncbi:hypothetical protein [Enterococcus gallinarum]|uniref:hypothetical protein n=1 Tax=Enterococcus gallinarum TaxID=1353 RepID=UPI0018AA281B|nr:hypothetical protein [Enterococcus gallinarum]
MRSFISFLSSSLFANILAILGIVIAIIPQKDTVSIDNSTTYYFESRNTNHNNNQSSLLFYGLGVIITYIIYSFFQSYYTIILISLAFLVIIRYRILKIAYRKQMIIPIIFVIVSITLHHFLPSEVINYWHHAYKIDIQQSNTLTKLVDQLINPIHEIKSLISTIETSTLSVAILANIIFVVIPTFFMFQDLFKPKKNIKVTKNSDIIIAIIFLIIIVPFIFYTENNSPARIVTEHIIYFLTH